MLASQIFMLAVRTTKVPISPKRIRENEYYIPIRRSTLSLVAFSICENRVILPKGANRYWSGRMRGKRLNTCRTVAKELKLSNTSRLTESFTIFFSQYIVRKQNTFVCRLRALLSLIWCIFSFHAKSADMSMANQLVHLTSGTPLLS